MRIENGQQLLTQIDSGQHFALNNRGQLETQGLMSRFGQKIGDFFRSFTTQGKLDIQQRNLNVQMAMTQMLRNDNALPNLAAAHPEPVLRDLAITNTVVARTELAKQLDGVSSDIRPGIRKAVMQQLHNAGTLSMEHAEDVRTAVQRQVAKFSTPDMKFFFSKLNIIPTPDDQKEITRLVHKGLLKDFTPDKQLKNLGEFGINNNYLSDSSRGFYTINGTKATASNAQTLIIEAVPSMFRPFVSTVMSQEGIQSALADYTQGTGAAALEHFKIENTHSFETSLLHFQK